MTLHQALKEMRLAEFWLRSASSMALSSRWKPSRRPTSVTARCSAPRCSRGAHPHRQGSSRATLRTPDLGRGSPAFLGLPCRYPLETRTCLAGNYFLGIRISRLIPPNLAASRESDTVDCVARRAHFDPSLPYDFRGSNDCNPQLIGHRN